MENELFLSNFQNVIKNHIYSWAEVMQGYAINLFLILATIALIVNVILIILESGGGIDTNKIISFILKFSFVTGFFFFILQNGIDFASNIIKYFISIGNDSLGYGAENKGAIENILSAIYTILGSAFKGITIGKIAVVLLKGLLSLLIIFILLIILGNYIVEVSSSFILVYAGYIVLAFGATQWTREWVINYFKAVLGIGLKILTLMFLIGITLEFLNKQISMFNNGNAFTIANGVTILITVVILMMVMNKVPNAVASLVSSAWGHMSGLNMATVAATMMAAAQTAKTAMSVINKAGGAAVEGVKNYRAGLSDAADRHKNQLQNNTATNQNDTFTPNNNNNIPNINNGENKQSGSGMSYWAGRGTGWGLAKYKNHRESKKNQTESDSLQKADNSNNGDSNNLNQPSETQQASSNDSEKD